MDTYPSYKDSGVEWIGDIPSGWDLVKVKNLFTFSKGSGISKKDIEKEGSSNCILYGELFTRFKNFNVIPDDFSKTNLKDKIVSNGNELLIPGSTTTTSVDLCNCKTLKHSGVQLGGDIIILKPRKSDIKNEFYSYYITTVTKPDFEMNGRGVTIHHIYPKQIREIYTPVPPLQEQQQISDYLDYKTSKIDTLIEKNQQKIELLKEQRISLINTTVTKGLNPNVEMKDSGVEWIGDIPSGWGVKPLKYVAEYNLSSLGNNTDPEYKLNYLEISDVDSLGNIKKPTKYTFSKSPSRCRRIVQKDDIIISTVRTYLKSIGFIKNEVKDLICSTGFCVITPNKTIIIPSILFYMVRMESFISTVISSSVGVSYPSINSDKLVGVKILIPPLQEQQQIVDYLDLETSKIDKLVNIESKRINLLKEYRQSLISEVVTGKVDVRDEVLL